MGKGHLDPDEIDSVARVVAAYLVGASAPSRPRRKQVIFDRNTKAFARFVTVLILAQRVVGSLSFFCWRSRSCCRCKSCCRLWRSLQPTTRALFYSTVHTLGRIRVPYRIWTFEAVCMEHHHHSTSPFGPVRSTPHTLHFVLLFTSVPEPSNTVLSR